MHELLFLIFKQLVGNDRSHRGIYVKVISVLAPADCKRFLLLRRESKQIGATAHTALGWDVDAIKGQTRTGAAAKQGTKVGHGGGRGRSRKKVRCFGAVLVRCPVSYRS